MRLGPPGGILARMVSPRRADGRRETGRAPNGLKAPAFVLLALAGTWLAHTLEYLRVWGTDGLVARLLAPLHLWMIPVGGVLLVVAAAGGVRWVRLHRGLSERVEQARLRLARRLRNLPPPPRPVRPRRSAVPAGTRARGLTQVQTLSLPARLASLWISLTATIGVVYLVQENVEAAASSMPLPGLAAMTGLHAAAPLVIAATAFLLAACAVEGRRRTATAAADVDAMERLLRSLEGSTRQPTGQTAPLPVAPRLRERLGAQLWSRPPPRRSAFV